MTVARVFWSGVLGTYVVALLVWARTGQPSTGTSVIGFTFVCELAATAVVDLIHQLGLVPKGYRGLDEFARALGLAIFAVLAIYFGGLGYLWMNGSYILHLVGGAVSGATIVTWLKSKDVDHGCS